MIDNRLKKVSEYIIGEKLLDVGSDHAYLAIYSLQNNIIKKAICGEVVKGPYENSLKNVSAHQLEEKVDVRLGSGLLVLDNEPIDTVTICGMGGPLIASIIEEGFHKLVNNPRFVLSANTFSEPIRRSLIEKGYYVVDEEIVKDEKRNLYYETIVLDYGKKTYTDDELYFGPVNLKKRSPMFIERLESEKKHLEQVIKNIKEKSTRQSGLEETEHRLSRIKGVLNNEN